VSKCWVIMRPWRECWVSVYESRKDAEEAVGLHQWIVEVDCSPASWRTKGFDIDPGRTP